MAKYGQRPAHTGQSRHKRTFLASPAMPETVARGTWQKSVRFSDKDKKARPKPQSGQEQPMSTDHIWIYRALEEIKKEIVHFKSYTEIPEVTLKRWRKLFVSAWNGDDRVPMFKLVKSINAYQYKIGHRFEIKYHCNEYFLDSEKA